MITNYLPVAREYAQAFMAILEDLKENKNQRPCGQLIPENLESKVSPDEIFERYSSGDRNGKFTITNFRRLGDSSLGISFELIDHSARGGEGVELRYKLDGAGRYKYDIDILDWKVKL